MHQLEDEPHGDDTAGNGLLSRRHWLQLGAGTAAAAVMTPLLGAGVD